MSATYAPKTDAANRSLGMRVANNTATPDELRQYREQRAERDVEFNTMRASRTEEYSALEQKGYDKKHKDLTREFEEVSAEMSSMSGGTPTWNDMRGDKLALAYEIEDLQRSRDHRAYNERQESRDRRSDERKQLDIAKNLPLSQAVPSDAPGSEETGGDPSIDSRELLKGNSSRYIPAAREDSVYAGADAGAKEAVSR